jgi:hypothetical protein
MNNRLVWAFLAGAGPADGGVDALLRYRGAGGDFAHALLGGDVGVISFPISPPRTNKCQAPIAGAVNSGDGGIVLANQALSDGSDFDSTAVFWSGERGERTWPALS